MNDGEAAVELGGGETADGSRALSEEAPLVTRATQRASAVDAWLSMAAKAARAPAEEAPLWVVKPGVPG